MSENGNKPCGGNPVPNSAGTRFKKGESGNLAGRPRTAAFSQACREVLSAAAPGDRDGRTNAQAIAGKLAEMARAGDVRAAVELADRAEGRVRQAVEMENAAPWRTRGRGGGGGEAEVPGYNYDRRVYDRGGGGIETSQDHELS
jgi:hypothetical protein